MSDEPSGAVPFCSTAAALELPVASSAGDGTHARRSVGSPSPVRRRDGATHGGGERTSVVHVFAGQGARPTRGQLDLALSLPGGADLLGRAAAAAGLDGARGFSARGGRALDSTAVLQPLVVALSLAIAAQLPPADAALGHSLGELSAAAAAGAMMAVDAVDLAGARGAAMQAAAEQRRGGLVAIDPIAAGPRALDVALAIPGVHLALDNAPDEIVLGGDDAALRALAAAIPCRRLDVAGAFHGPSMATAADRLRVAMHGVAWDRLRLPLWSCVTAELVEDAASARHRLVAGMTRPVRFREAILSLAGSGARLFVIAGPGAALRGLIRRMLPAARVLTTETAADLDRIHAVCAAERAA